MKYCSVTEEKKCSANVHDNVDGSQKQKAKLKKLVTKDCIGKEVVVYNFAYMKLLDEENAQAGYKYVASWGLESFQRTREGC